MDENNTPEKKKMNKSKTPKVEKTFTTPGSRIGTLLYSLDKLNCSSSEDVEQIRYTTAKIQHCIKEQDKVRKDVMSISTGGVEILLATLESSTDIQTSVNIAVCLLELLGTAKRASSLVSRGATQILLSALGSCKNQTADPELLLLLHQILAKIGPKDRKFGVKARLSGALPITQGMLRTNGTNVTVLQPVLQVLKVYATNSVNSSYLGKSGAVTALFRIISLCGRKNNSVLKLCLETLCLLVKSKSNSARALGQGGMTLLLTLAFTWHQHDARNKHLGIRKSILNVIKNITTLKSGKRAFNEADGTKILFGIAREMVDRSTKDVESVVNLISLILRKCSQKNRLPLSTIKGAFKFDLPDGAVGKEILIPNGVDDVIDDSDDQDDDISSSDEHKDEDADLSEECTSTNVSPSASCTPLPSVSQESDADMSSISRHKRSAEDLAMYDHFFLEMTDYEEDMREIDGDFNDFDDDDDDNEISFKAIHIPTGETNDAQRFYSMSRLEHSRQGQSPTRIPGLRENRLSLPELNQYGTSLTGSPPLSPRMQSLAMNVSVLTIDQRACSPNSSEQDVSLARTKSTSRTKQGGATGSPNRNSPKHTPKHHRSQPQLQGSKASPKIQKLSKSTTAIKHRSPERLRNSPSRGSPSRGSPSRGSPSRNSPSRNGISRNSPSKSSPKKKSKKLKIIEQKSQSSNLDSFIKISQMQIDTGIESSDYVGDLDILGANLEDIGPEEYGEWMYKTKRVMPFHCIAHPEICGYSSPDYLSIFTDKKPKVQRDMIFEDIDRVLHSHNIIDKVVYDIDEAVQGKSGRTSRQRSAVSSRWDPSNREDDNSTLNFNSLFESGNLRKAIQVRKYEYDLLLNPDINSNHHHQWFYFAVSNTRAGVKYRFNIINCEKLNSQFNFGMQPVVYSVREAMEGNPGWIRTGEDICYYKNNYSRSTAATGGQKGKSYHTVAFHLMFTHNNDIVYMAYHFPYTYTMLQVHICKLEASLGEWSGVYYRNQTFCETLAGNPLPLLTITANPMSLDKEGITEFRSRPYIFLSSRVHPGESNSSWVMKGVLQFLMSQHPTAEMLRRTYIFKIVPMLNPDGVINGSHRCSLSGEDLNRQWINPSPDVHPTIYHTKGLLQYLTMVDKAPFVYCDFHGHSRKKNVFLYGNSSSQSYLPSDVAMKEDTSYKTLPRILSQIAPAFYLGNCSFVVEKAKEGTARVVVWREMGVNRCYTMESTYCGFDQGLYKGYQITTQMLEEMGQNFCEALLRLVKQPQQSRSSTSVIYPYVMYDKEDSPDEDVLYMRDVLSSSASGVAAYRMNPNDDDDDYGSDDVLTVISETNLLDDDVAASTD